MQRFAVYLKTVQRRGYPPLSKNYGVFFYAGNRGFCAVYTARRITPRTTFRCWRSTYASKLARFAIKRIHLFPPKKKASKFRCFLFLCEREWMKNRCKATVRTVAYSNGAVVQLVYHCTTQCSVLLFIYELPNAEAIHLFRILWWILNHLSVLDASLCVQARSLSLLYESTSSHHKETIILIRKNRYYGFLLPKWGYFFPFL